MESGVSINFYRCSIGACNLDLDSLVPAVEKEFFYKGKNGASQSSSSIGREDFEVVKISRFFIPYFQQREGGEKAPLSACARGVRIAVYFIRAVSASFKPQRVDRKNTLLFSRGGRILLILWRSCGRSLRRRREFFLIFCI